MKKIALIASTALATAALNAAPLFTIGDQVDVFFKGSVIGKWDSNMYMKNTDKIDDYSYTFRVGLEANYGRNSKFKASVRFYEDIVRYVVQTNANSNLANVFANLSYTEERWSVLANFSFNQVAQNTESMALGTDELIRRDIYNFNLKGAYDFTDKLNGEIGFGWYREDFRDNPPGLNGQLAYSDRNTYSIPVSLLYRVTDTLNAGLTYQYRTTDYTKGNNADRIKYGNNVDDHFIGLTLRGELYPRLSTEASVGYAYRDLYQANDGDGETESTISFSARFDYLITDKLTTFVSGFRDFGNGAARQSTINTGMRVGLNYSITDKIQLYGAFGYTYSDYDLDSRKDDWFSYHAGITYTPNRYFVLSATYDFYTNQSSEDTSSYNRHLVSLNVTLRY